MREREREKGRDQRNAFRTLSENAERFVKIMKILTFAATTTHYLSVSHARNARNRKRRFQCFEESRPAFSARFFGRILSKQTPMSRPPSLSSPISSFLSLFIPFLSPLSIFGRKKEGPETPLLLSFPLGPTRERVTTTRGEWTTIFHADPSANILI